MAKLVKTDGTMYDPYPCETLEDLQKGVDGYIEPVYTDEWVALVNEEGRLKDLPYNSIASSMLNQMIVGNAIIMTHEEWQSRD